MPVSPRGTLFALALVTVLGQAGCPGKPAAGKPDASKKAEDQANALDAGETLGSGAAPQPAPVRPSVVMEELPGAVAPTSLSSRLPAGRVLASGRRGIADAIVDGAYVYFASTSEGTIHRVPLAGGALELVASGQLAPHRLAARGGALYWLNRGEAVAGRVDAFLDGQLVRAPLAGGTAVVLAERLDDPVALAFAGSAVVVATAGASGTLWRIPMAGGAARKLAGGLLEPTAVTAEPDGGPIYVATRQDGVIWRVAGAGGAPEPFAEGVDQPIALTLNGGRLVWVAQGSAGGEGKIGARSLGGIGAAARPELLAEGLERPRALSFGHGQLAWLEDGLVERDPPHFASLRVAGVVRSSTPRGLRALAAVPGGWILAGPSDVTFVPLLPAARAATYELLAPAPGQPRALAADAHAVYWATYQGAIMKAPRVGGAPLLLAHAPRGVSAMTIASGGLDDAGAALVWTNFDAGTVSRVPVAGGAIVELASGRPHPIAVAARAGEVYFADDDGVHVVAAAGGPVRRLAALGGPSHALAVDDEAAYLLVSAAGRDRLVRVPLGGGAGGAAVQVLADGLAGADAIAVDGDFVYWLDEDDDDDFANARGQVSRTPRRGLPPGRAHERLAAGLSGPAALVVAAGVVWFAYSDGRVARLPGAGGSIEIVAGGGRNVEAVRLDGDDVLVASGGTLAGGWKDGAILRLALRSSASGRRRGGHARVRH